MSRKLLFVALLLALVCPVRAQDDSESMKIELRDGKVRVRIHTKDGKDLDRELLGARERILVVIGWPQFL